MATIVCILGSSGDGKTTSTIVNPDGKFDMQNYQGMDPKTHFILNLDCKSLPFPSGMWDENHHNYMEAARYDKERKSLEVDFNEIKKGLMYCAKNPDIKSVAIDTVNIYLAMKEFNDRKKMSYDFNYSVV